MIPLRSINVKYIIMFWFEIIKPKTNLRCIDIFI